jgi:hypothetical protein
MGTDTVDIVSVVAGTGMELGPQFFWNGEYLEGLVRTLAGSTPVGVGTDTVDIVSVVAGTGMELAPQFFWNGAYLEGLVRTLAGST